MRLSQLLAEAGFLSQGGDTLDTSRCSAVLSLPSTPIEITGLTCDSRQVQPGNLFLAYRGLNVDGHDYIAEAVARGAVAVVGERPRHEIPGLPDGMPYVQVSDGRVALARLAAAWHGYPARRMVMIGVTGTDGKTTTVNLIQRILAAAGHKTGLISTVNALIGDTSLDTGLHTTTPDALAVQGYLRQMVEAGMTHCVLEATSEGLAQRRVEACDFDVAVVTNITHEHLYFHGTFDAYREAKALLFHSLHQAHRKSGVPKVAVLNTDDPSFPYLRAIPADMQITYGLDGPADVTAESIAYEPAATRFTVRTPQGAFPVQTSLIGRFNVYNILAAVSVGVALGVPVSAMQEGIRAVRGVKGRMERIDMGQPFTVIIDFAHTPNALKEALQTVRSLTQGRVIVVFGCAGLRDVAKRPMMGRVAGELADLIVLTAEDPRTEDVHDIMRQIAVGCEEAGRREGEDYFMVADRKEAIAFAVQLARPGDLVIVTGKGHEQSMCYGTTEYPWSEHQAVREALAKRN